MLHFSALPPLALYIHYPWCLRKCPYCDFNSHQSKEDNRESDYIDALLADLQQELPEVWGRPIESVFIGGGTPSLISPDGMERLLSGLRALLALTPNTEITLEANPGTAEQGRFHAYRQAGINRLSLGIQSFNDTYLQRLGRVHSAREATAAVEMAHKAGFERLNLDLMFGLPEQSAADAESDLRQALSLEPGHISYYQLTLEPNTAFAHTPPPLPDDDTLWGMQQRGIELLSGGGYQRYEVSAYARAGQQCQHNLNYWQFGDYLGIGAGAHGKLTQPDHGGFMVLRRWKVRHPNDYLNHASSATRINGEQQLTPGDLSFEFMLNAMRLRKGVPSRLFSEHTGLPISAVEKPLKQAEAQELLEWSLERIAPTEKGYNYLNNLLELFLDEKSPGGKR